MSRVRSQTFFSHGAFAAAAAAALPCPAAPRNHPFVKYGRRTEPPPHVLEPRARHWIISRSTVPPARGVLNQADVGNRGGHFGKTTVPIHGPPQTEPHRGGTAPGEGTVPTQPFLVLFTRCLRQGP